MGLQMAVPVRIVSDWWKSRAAAPHSKNASAKSGGQTHTALRAARQRFGVRRCCAALAVWTILPLAMAPLHAEDKVDAAMAKATQYLVSTQDPASGGIHNKMRHETAMTSLAVLAMAACGHQPADPTPEGESMRKARAFVVRPEAQEKDGYFGQNDGSRMYGHGITTLMLSEMLGMGADAAQDEVIRNK